jgi:LysR family transcriptional regulator, regulator for bpeEF and oprC
VRDVLADVPVFVAVAKAGGFSRAARDLGVSGAAVSKAVRRLEEALGAPLFSRTTRQVALTEEGELFLVRCEEALSQLRAGRDTLALAQQVAEGEVRVSLSFTLGRFLSARLPALLERYPGLRVHLKFTDRLAGLVSDRVDVALRLGPLEDSDLIARRLWQTRWATVASPAYLAKRGTPTTLADLAHHRCIKFCSPRGKVTEWSFHESGESRTYSTPTAISIDQGEYLVDAAVAGAGISQVFAYMIGEHVRDGRLVEVLPGNSAPGPPLHALCLRGHQHLPRIRALMSFLSEAFAGADAHTSTTPRRGPAG